jgi:hypothetical protein
MKQKSYIFSKDFGLFYLKSFFFVMGYNGYFILKLPNIYYEKKEAKKLSLIFLSYYHFQSVLKSIITLYDRLFLYYFSRLRMKGLGFRLRRISEHLYKFYFVFVNFYYMHIPSSILFKKKGRILLFFSSNFYVLQTLLSNLVLLKATIPYRKSGLMFPKKLIILRVGKKRLK